MTTPTITPLPKKKADIKAHVENDHGVIRIYGGPMSLDELWWDHFRHHEEGTPPHAHDFSQWGAGVR